MNPASRIKKKAEDNEIIRYLTKEEEERLVAVIKKHWPRYFEAFLIAVHTGMRSSGQFNLTWRDVSFERRQIRRKKAGGKKMPPLPLNSVAYEAFVALHARTGGKGFVFLNTKGDRLRIPATGLSRRSNWRKSRTSPVTATGKRSPPGWYWRQSIFALLHN
ncbi:MAG: tyrosine-type recombinase/integrase [Terracidiphilus sp.]